MFIALLSADGVRCLCNTISRHLRQGRGHKPMPCVLSLIELPRGRLRQAWAFFKLRAVTGLDFDVVFSEGRQLLG